ncbi:MAG: hypothetical protein ACRD1T_24790, partial [Acidimicrobiia bacterium]
HRGTWLDANQIQNIRNKISNKDHMYGNTEGMVSGPIRRSKMFFMGGYQGFYEDIPFPTTRTVPTEAQLRGDFRETRNNNGQQIIVFDPATTVPNPSGTGFIREQIQCNGVPNVICPDRFHPIARALSPHIPRPNATGSLSGANNFINSPSLGRYRYNSYLTRVDQVFNDKHRLSVSHAANWGIEFRNENGLPPPALCSDNYPTHRNQYFVTGDDTYTLSSSTLWNTRVSFNRFDEPHEKEYGDIDPSLPFQGAYQVTGPPFPQINITGYELMFPNTFRQVRNDAFSVRSSLSTSRGEHLFKFGGEYRAYNYFRIDGAASNGTFDFGTNFTRRNPLQGDTTSGNGFASFLLGLPTG